MNSSPTTPSIKPPRSRYVRLMNLYEDNYWRLTRVLGPERLTAGRYLSRTGDGFDLHLAMAPRCPYTLEFELSYALPDPDSGTRMPSAIVRLYRDAQLAEVLACYGARRIEDVIGRAAPSAEVINHRLRMNGFFNKWLDYLEGAGHSRFSLTPVALVENMLDAHP
jgi:uncharacterized protein YqiB (DUF1249 family)